MLKLDFSALKNIIDGMREPKGSFFAAQNGGVLLKTIALANQKGGVRKTTTAASLGIGLARHGKKVLLVDADAQGNLTQMLGWRQPDELSPTLADLLTKTVNEEPIAPGEGILHHAGKGDFRTAPQELRQPRVRHGRLRHH